MKIIYGKQLNNSEVELANNISKECGILYDTARLLIYRGIKSVGEAKVFLTPSKEGFLNPFHLNGVLEAVKKIKKIREEKQTICIFGDYDADGVCASTILYKCLEDFGVKSYIIIPEREDGYGLNVNKVLSLYNEKKFSLLITVDCGISDSDKIEIIKQSGIDVIVTDHHEPPEKLPECVCINPKLPNPNYSFNGLCGAGVAYKLGFALINERANNLLDFVALATVADSMDLTNENRCLVYEGLKLFSPNKIRKCFKNLIGQNERQVNAQMLAFTIAPRINAGGRMNDANTALKLFLSDDEEEIFDLSVKLNSYNIARQAECDVIYKCAKAKIEKDQLYKRNSILLYDKEWRVGFIGIVAARLVEDYNRPVIVFAGHDGALKGSARSVEGVNIFDAISSSSDILVAFGGHSQAAGVTVKEEDFNLLYERIERYVSEHLSSNDFEGEIAVDWEKDDAISSRFAKEIDMLEPFGTGNRRPLFVTSISGEVKANPLKAGSNHYSFKENGIDMLYFNGGKDIFNLSLPIDKKVIYEINLSTFRNTEYVKGYVRKVVPDFSEIDRLSLYVFYNELVKLKEKENGKRQYINYGDIQVNNGFGTLYVISDERNINRYNYRLKPCFFEPIENGRNCLCVSPKYIPNCYENVIYLDNPIYVSKCKGISKVVNDISGVDRFLSLKVEREELGKTFNVLRTLCGRTFIDSLTFYKENVSDLDGYQFIFSTEVFIELGIFYISNGKLKQNCGIKNALNNSKIYNTILKLKGGVC